MATALTLTDTSAGTRKPSRCTTIAAVRCTSGPSSASPRSATSLIVPTRRVLCAGRRTRQCDDTAIACAISASLTHMAAEEVRRRAGPRYRQTEPHARRRSLGASGQGASRYRIVKELCDAIVGVYDDAHLSRGRRKHEDWVVLRVRTKKSRQAVCVVPEARSRAPTSLNLTVSTSCFCAQSGGYDRTAAAHTQRTHAPAGEQRPPRLCPPSSTLALLLAGVGARCPASGSAHPSQVRCRAR